MNNMEDKERLLEALKIHNGMIALACESVGLERRDFYRFYKSDDRFAEEYNAILERVIDRVEKTLIEKALEGDMRAIETFLKAKGKKRGYDKEAASITDEGKIVLNLPEDFIKKLRKTKES